MIAGHTGDVRGVVRRWYEAMLQDRRFETWQPEFNVGGDHPGAGAGVRFENERALAELHAWPNGCIDASIARISDQEPNRQHAEVDSEDEIMAFALAFGERLVALAAQD